jgi:hypothetical protein
MSDTATQAVNLNRNIPTFLPLAEAVQKLGLSRKVLTRLIEAGKIEAVQLPSGEVLVSAETNGYEPKTKQGIIAEKFVHLRRQTINAYEAQKKYGIHPSTFIRWARAGYIEIVKEEKGRLIVMREDDVAYCAYIYNKKKDEYGGKISGVRVFDENGNPYQVKYPDLSAKRRE